MPIIRIVFRNKSLHGSKRSANITFLNCFCEDADFFMEDFGFRERLFRRVNAGMPGGLRLGGIDEQFFIEFFSGTEAGELNRNIFFRN